MQSHFLQPGQIFVSKEPYEVHTILGSCVAVCIFDRVKKIGAINHYLLPNPYGNESLTEPYRYAVYAIPAIVEGMEKLGSLRRHCTAEIVGGSNKISLKPNHDVGSQNIRIAIAHLLRMEIPIISQNVGGAAGRKIAFFTHTGEIKVQVIESQKPPDIPLKKPLANLASTPKR